MKKANIIFLKFLALVSIFNAGCIKNNEGGLNTISAQYIVEEDTMATILCEMALTESALNQNVQNYSAAKFDSVYNFNALKSHNVSKERFDSTLYYYSKHPEDYKTLYELVLEKLNQKK